MKDKTEVTNQDPSYKYRIVDEDKSRIADLEEDGWKLCTKEKTRMGEMVVMRKKK